MSDSENELDRKEENGEDDDDLFGEKSDEDQKSGSDDNKQEDSNGSDEEKKTSRMSVDDENQREVEDEEEMQSEEKQFGPPETLEYCPLPQPSQSAKLFYVRLPNILGIESKPFDEDTYEEVQPIERFDEETGHTKKTLLNPETVIRWRYSKDENGNLIKESNSRFVRWSDGSLQLFVGSEVYDVTVQDISQDNNHLYVRQKGFIRCHGKLDSKMTFRPSSLGSKSHQKLTTSIVQRHKKEKRIKLVKVEVDPEKDLEKAEKNEKGKQQMNRKKANKAKRINSQAGISTEFLEDGVVDDDDDIEYDNTHELDVSDSDSDQEDEGNISAIKARFGGSSIAATPKKKLKDEKRKRDARSLDEEAEKKILMAKETPVKPPVKTPSKSDNDNNNTSAIEPELEDDEVALLKKKKKRIVSDD